ncbi:bombesin receptor subtype-3-like [Apostichopus japonicus]|uniref:bombesin receptor subtype-3-like n=1 Tax=Stichopus japonicus TaxID=307972 RepID=UPI003AB7A188
MSSSYNFTVGSDDYGYDSISSYTFSGSDRPDVYQRSKLSATIYNIALVVILVFGVIANTAVLSLVAFVRELRGSSNVFISMLCASNILMLVTIIPLDLVDQDSFKLPPAIANLKHYILLYCCTLSVLSLVMLSFERWCAVVRPTWHNVIGIGWKVGTVFILGALLALPYAFTYDRSGGIRAKDFRDFLAYYGFVVLYVVPLAIIFCMYVFVAITLCKQSKPIKESVKRNKKARAGRTRIARVVICLAICFAVCWLPFHLLVIFAMFDESHDKPSDATVLLLHWRTCFQMFNTCCDPLSIFLMGSRFRRHLLSGISRIFHVPLNLRTTLGRSRRDPSTSATMVQMK